MMSNEERDAAKFDTNMFQKMMELVKTVNWESIDGVREMIKLGWEYEYHRGLVDKTPHYTRYEEDTIRFKKNKATLQINMTTGTLVIQDLHSYDEFYYGNPTVFLTADELFAIYEITDTIKILAMSVTLSNN